MWKLDAVVAADGPFDQARRGEAGEQRGEAGLEKIADGEDGRGIGILDEAQNGLGGEGWRRGGGHVALDGVPHGFECGMRSAERGVVKTAGRGVKVGQDVAGLEVGDADGGVGKFQAEARA